MSERGYIAVDRGVFEHDCFADEPFTEREAWLWLIAEAAWKPRTRRIGRVVVDLQRGQFAGSLRFIAERWGWNKDKVDRYFCKLKNRDMIETEAATGITVITICNYDEYQNARDAAATDSETQTETEVRQQCDNNKEIKTIKPETKDSEANASATDPRADLFNRGRKSLEAMTGKTPDSCRSLLGKWLKMVDDEAIHVLAAIDDASQNRIANPVPWIEMRFRSRGPPAGRPQTVRDVQRLKSDDALAKLDASIARDEARSREAGGQARVEFLPRSGRG